jgi:hypothetical protein
MCMDKRLDPRRRTNVLDAICLLAEDGLPERLLA